MYDAFISYRRSDGARVAAWLRRELASFRPPRTLRDRFGHKLAIYLDTAYERGASDFYEQSIRPALLSSRYLIVIATPEAVRSSASPDDWIAREISDFLSGPNAANVIAVRGAGEFDDPLPAGLDRRFAHIEIVDLRGAGRLWYLNPSRAARLTAEKIKIIAPLLDIPHEEMPRLRQEDEKRQQSRLGIIAGATAGVLVAVSALSVFALQSRNRATRALEDSMFATGSMVLLSKRLPDGGDGQTIRRFLINQGCDLIDKLSLGSGRDPQIAELIACKLERAHQREELKELDEARRLLQEAVMDSTARYAQVGRSDVGLHLLESRQALAEYLARQNDGDAAQAAYQMLLTDARRLRGDHKYSVEFAQAEGEALGQLGDNWRSRGEGSRAAESYAAAAATVSNVLELQGQKTSPHAVGWLTRLHRLAGEQRFQLGDFQGAREQFQRSLEAAARVQSNSYAVAYETAWTHAMIFRLEKQQKDAVAAEKSRIRALKSIDIAMTSDSLSDDLKARAVRLRTWLDEQASAN